jgi:hypothetical protein
MLKLPTPPASEGYYSPHIHLKELTLVCTQKYLHNVKSMNIFSQKRLAVKLIRALNVWGR